MTASRSSDERGTPRVDVWVEWVLTAQPESRATRVLTSRFLMGTTLPIHEWIGIRCFGMMPSIHGYPLGRRAAVPGGGGDGQLERCGTQAAHRSAHGEPPPGRVG